MEPRPSERGNISSSSSEVLMSGRLQWSHVLPNVETRTEPGCGLLRRRFNGATSFRTWKREGRQGVTMAGASLQWSHVLPNVETLAAACLADKSGGSFNGATSFRTWKRKEAQRG